MDSGWITFVVISQSCFTPILTPARSAQGYTQHGPYWTPWTGRGTTFTYHDHDGCRCRSSYAAERNEAILQS